MASEAPENGPSGGGSSSPSSPSKSRKSRKEKGSSSKKSKDTSKKKLGQRSSDIYASALPLATKTKPETKEQLERWLLDTLSQNPLGMTPSAVVHTFFQEFREPLQAPVPAWVDDEAKPNDEYFIHTSRTPVRDPLKVLMSTLEGVVYESSTNKYVMGDRHELLRVHMKVQVAKVAAGVPVRQDHWYTLFRALDKDGSGKLNRNEFYEFVRGEEFMHMTIGDYPDEAVWEVFMALDDDNGGQISVDELVAFAD
eukprot:CAMPEP_0119534642 /NCGR_PEP_ID=MMETSP1344-20130328/47837_1 /TAXON_ID=236787 /ORGANISM="Florenciella parvula, Strain CCMP2471" /LENGTH=252 /DNA_ID=CAMNT_0007575963 /DNA_START=102 /DNA_END=857 /DNA_ORIENTATION=-